MRSLVYIPLALLAAAAACKQDDTTVVFVTVEARPTVRSAATLHVEVANAGAMRSQDFALPGGDAFPVTFTVTPSDRSGDLTISAVALDATGGAVARGEITGAIAGGRTDLALTLEPDDFPVNSAAADFQWITYFEDFTGRQIAATDDGAFVVTWENSCPLGRCDIFGRLFGPDTLPDVNGTSVSEDDFIIQLTNEYTESPSIAAGPGGYLIAWMGMADGATTRDVKAVALTADAAHVGVFDTSVTLTAIDDERRATALARSDGTYVVVWERPQPAPSGDILLRARVLDAQGETSGAEFGVSASPTGVMNLPHGAGLAGGGFVIVWGHTASSATTSNVRARAFDAAGQPTTAADILVTNYPSAAVAGAHVAATAGGFVATWQAFSLSDAQLSEYPLRMRRFAADGAPTTTEIEVVPETLDVFTVPAIATRGDGAIGVTWHDCMARGDGSECGIRFRLFHPSGLPAGDDVIVNTTSNLSQRTPSIIGYGQDAFLLGWTDGSMAPPDSSETGVRARVLYPSLIRRDGVIGARCGGPSDASCGDGLDCAQSVPEQADLCHPTCASADGTTCRAGGICQAGVCLFD